jgi:glycosyltransferase involved in cell wall biosynthesis
MCVRRVMTRILVTTDAVGGVWRYSMELCSAWAERGIDIVLAVLGPAPGAAQRREAASIERLLLLETGLSLDWTARDRHELEQVCDELAGIARRHGASSVHLHAPALVGRADWPVPVVATIHSCLLTWWQAMRTGAPPDEFAWRIQATSAGLRRADAIAAPSAAFAADVRHAYQLGRSITVVHNGRRPLPLPVRKRAPGVFAAGRLWDAAKNAAGLDRAAAAVPVPVNVAGPARAPDGSHVTLRHARHLGVLDDDALADHLARNTVFAGVSMYEPFGLAVLEAAQSGMALVLSDIPVFRELWNNAAIFVDPCSTKSISAGLDEALRHPAPLARASGLRTLAFSRDAMAGATLNIHASLRCAKDVLF